MDLIPHNYYEAESVSFITRRNKDDVGWFLVHKSASSEAQNMTTETYDNDREPTSILAAKYPSHDADGHWILLSSYIEGPGSVRKKVSADCACECYLRRQYNREIVF